MPVEDFLSSADGFKGNVLCTFFAKQLYKISQLKQLQQGKKSAGHTSLTLTHSELYLGVSETDRPLNLR